MKEQMELLCFRALTKERQCAIEAMLADCRRFDGSTLGAELQTPVDCIAAEEGEVLVLDDGAAGVCADCEAFVEDENAEADVNMRHESVKVVEGAAIKCFYLYYEKGAEGESALLHPRRKPAALLAIFLTDEGIAELSAFTAPAYRRRGLFSGLLYAARIALRRQGISKQFLLYEPSATTSAVCRAIGARYSHSEYLLAYAPKGVQQAGKYVSKHDSSCSVGKAGERSDQEKISLRLRRVGKRTVPHIAALYARLFSLPIEEAEQQARWLKQDRNTELLAAYIPVNGRRSCDARGAQRQRMDCRIPRRRLKNRCEARGARCRRKACLLLRMRLREQCGAQYRLAGTFAIMQGRSQRYLLLFGITPALQRQGIGRQLLQEVLHRYADKRHTLYLQVSEKNRRACALYFQAGFVITQQVTYAQLGLEVLTA